MESGVAIPAAFEALAATIPARVGDAAAAVQSRIDAIAPAIKAICLPVMTVGSGTRGAVVEACVDAIAPAVEAMFDAVAPAIHPVRDAASNRHAAEIVCAGCRARGQQAQAQYHCQPCLHVRLPAGWARNAPLYGGLHGGKRVTPVPVDTASAAFRARYDGGTRPWGRDA